MFQPCCNTEKLNYLRIERFQVSSGTCRVWSIFVFVFVFFRVGFRLVPAHVMQRRSGLVNIIKTASTTIPPPSVAGVPTPQSLRFPETPCSKEQCWIVHRCSAKIPSNLINTIMAISGDNRTTFVEQV